MYIIHDEDGNIKAISPTYISMEGCRTIDITIEETHPIFMGEFYRVVDGNLVKDNNKKLVLAKEIKIDELRTKCQETILAGFTHEFNGVIYWFSLDYEAQQNFTSTYQLFKDGLVNEIPWTVRIDGVYSRLILNEQMMNDLAVSILYHKTNNIAKFRDILLPLVQDATTIQEVESIVW